MIFKDDLEPLEESFQKTLAGILEPFEFRFFSKSGKIQWLHSSSRPIVRDGNIIGLQGVITDITDRKKAEEDSRRSREKYHNIFENSIVGFYQSMPEGRYLCVNPAFARLFGFNSPEEMIVSITDIGQQLYANQIDRKRAIKQLLEEGFLEGFELEVRHNNGTKFWVSMNTNIVQDENGLHYDGTVEDITKRKLAEDQVLFQASLLDQVNNAVITTDLFGNITYWNKFAEILYQWTANEVVGKNISETLVPKNNIGVMHDVMSRDKEGWTL